MTKGCIFKNNVDFIDFYVKIHNSIFLKTHNYMIDSEIIINTLKVGVE